MTPAAMYGPALLFMASVPWSLNAAAPPLVLVGCEVGPLGACVGTLVGMLVGTDGATVGTELKGALVGTLVGTDGCEVGLLVGTADG